MYQTHDQAGRASVLRASENGIAGALRGGMRAAAAVLLLFPALAWAGVTPTAVTIPADIGLQMTAQVQVPWKIGRAHV